MGSVRFVNAKSGSQSQLLRHLVGATAAAFMIACAGVAPALSQTAPASDAAKRGGTLTVGLSTQSQCLDPQQHHHG